MGELEDTQEIAPQIARMVEEIARRDDTGDRIRLSTMGEYLRKVRQCVKRLKVHRGEMRCPAKEKFTFRLCCPLSSRMYLKRINRDAEYLLTKWAEPFGAFAWLNDARYPEAVSYTHLTLPTN